MTQGLLKAKLNVFFAFAILTWTCGMAGEIMGYIIFLIMTAVVVVIGAT